MATSASAIAANTLGTLGAVCWSVQLIPQIWINYRRQHTHGLQPTMMLLWASAGIPLGIYNIIRSFPIALQIQPQILTFLSLCTWIQTQYYPPARDKKDRSVTWCMIVLGVMCAVAGGIEAAVVLALRTATTKRSEDQLEYYWPVVLMGALSAFLLCAGVARHYIDIWKERTVRGISFIFVGIDALGDLTSLLSVLYWWKAGRRLDVLGSVVYGSELALWTGVFMCGAYFNLWPWLVQKWNDWQERSSGTTQSRDSASADQNGRATQAGRQSPGSVSTNRSDRMSSTSGTVFRTASGRTMIDTAVNQNELGHLSNGALRMRSVIQVDV